MKRYEHEAKHTQSPYLYITHHSVLVISSQFLNVMIDELFVYVLMYRSCIYSSTFKVVPNGSSIHHSLGFKWHPFEGYIYTYIYIPWMSKTKQKMVFRMIQIKDSLPTNGQSLVFGLTEYT